MSILGGTGRKKKRFKRLFGMPDEEDPGTMEYGLTDYDYMPTIPGKRYGYKTLKGMPNTRQLNGGWGTDHQGNIENQNKTKSLLRKKRENFIKDPQDKRNEGKFKIDETDNKSGFLKDKIVRDGSISTNSTGMCLKGEENGIFFDSGMMVYGAKGGKRGWYKPEEVTPEKSEEQDVQEVDTTEVDLVVNVVWDPENHQLYMEKKKFKVVKDKELDKKEPEKEVILTAVPIQFETT